MVWKKTIIHKWENGEVGRYEYTKYGFTIDVNTSKKSEQGYPGSNQVNVFRKGYGGYILGTPKNFRSVSDAERFVSFAKKELVSGKFGKQVSFTK